MDGGEWGWVQCLIMPEHNIKPFDRVPGIRY